jgi:hypothetical protein
MINSIPYNFTYSSLGFGLQIWSNSARLVRLATRSGMSFLPFSSEFLEPAKTFKYYALAGLIISILLTCATLLLVWNYTVYLQGRKVEKRNDIIDLSPKRKSIAIIIGIVMLLFLSYSVVSSRSISNSLSGLKDSLNEMFYKFHSLSDGVVDDLVDAFAKIDQLIYSVSKASLRHVEADALPKKELMIALDEMASLLTRVQSNSKELLKLGENIAKSKSLTILQINNIVAGILPITLLVNRWTSSISLRSDVTYKLNSAVPTRSFINFANQLRSTVNTKSNGADQVDGLKSLDLTSAIGQAKEISREVVKIDNNRLMEIAGLSLNLMDGWRKAQNTMNSAFTTLRSILFDNINQGNSKSLEFIKLFDGFDIAQSVAVITVLVLFLVLFYMHLNDRISAVFWPFILLVFISAVVFFSVALVVGDVCSAVFDYSPPPIIETLGQVDSQLVDQLITLRDHCSTNNSLLTIVDNLGLLAPLEMNVLALSTATLDNIVPMLSFSEIIRFSPDLNTSLAPVDSLDDTLGETLLITNAFTSFHQTLDTLDLNLYQLETGVTINDFTILSGSPEDSQMIIEDFKSRIQRTRQDLLPIFSQTSRLSSSISALVQNYTAMGKLVSRTKLASQTITKDYEIVTKQIRDFSMHVIRNISRSNPIDELTQGIIRAQVQLLQDLECYTLAQEVFIIQDQICGKVLSSLDAQYFLYFIIAFLVVPLHLTMFALH